MKCFFEIIFTLSVLQSVAYADTSWDWVQKSKGKDTYSVIWELNKTDFFKLELPKYSENFGFEKKNKKSSLQKALEIVLGGPPDLSSSPDENSIVLTACRYQSCDEKGFLWANSQEKATVMAIVHFAFQKKIYKTPQLFVASKSYKCGEYPEKVKIQIAAWLKAKKLNPETTRCLQDGQAIETAL